MIHWPLFALFSGFAITAMRTSRWKNLLEKSSQKNILTKRSFYCTIFFNSIFLVFWFRLGHVISLYLHYLSMALSVGDYEFAWMFAFAPFVFLTGMIAAPFYYCSLINALCILSLLIVVTAAIFTLCIKSGLFRKIFSIIRPDFTAFWLIAIGFFTYFCNTGINSIIHLYPTSRLKAIINLIALPFPVFSLLVLAGGFIWWAYFAIASRKMNAVELNRTTKQVSILFLVAVIAELIYSLPALFSGIHAFLS